MPEPLPPNEVDSKNEYEHEEILQSAYLYNQFYYWVKDKGYLAEERK